MSDMCSAAATHPAPPPRPSATASALFRRAWSLYRRDFWAFFSVTLVALCLLMVWVAAIAGVVQARLPLSFSPEIIRGTLIFGAVLVGLVTYGAAYVACKGTIAVIVAAVLSGRRASAPEALVALVPGIRRLLGVFLLFGALYVAACFVPFVSLIAPAFLALIVPVAALEGRKPFAAVSRGLSLIFRSRPVGHPRGEATNAGRAVLLSLAMIPAMALAYLPACVLPFAVSAWMKMPVVVIMVGAMGAGVALIYPAFAIVDTLLYFDIRRRYEGFDVEAITWARTEREADGMESPDSGEPPLAQP